MPFSQVRAANLDSGRGWPRLLISLSPLAKSFQDFAIRLAIRLSWYHCFLCTSVPSVALHVVEFTFLGGFESHSLRQQVLTAEKFRRSFPKYAKYAQFLRYLLAKPDCSV
jgi:hypothetical protein